MTRGYKNLFYIMNGSIGDFLMAVYFLENVYLNENSRPENFYIITPRSKDALEDLLGKYPYISLIEVNKKNMSFKNLFSKNFVITTPTLGKLSLAVKFFGKILAINPGSRFVGFKDKSVIGNFLFSELFVTDFSRLYYEILDEVLEFGGWAKKNNSPHLSLEYSPNVLSKFNLDIGKYIVIHPFGSNSGRSIVGQRLDNIISIIKSVTNSKIVISGSSDDSKKSLNNKSELNLAGKLSLKEEASLIQGSSLYIGVDTGITHLASFLGKESLVIAENGTPHWLPFYNPKAKIIYKIRGDQSGVFEGREYLESKRSKDPRYLERVPIEVIEKCLREIIKK